MIKFSMGMITGACIGMGVMMMDKRAVKKAKKMYGRVMKTCGI